MPAKPDVQAVKSETELKTIKKRRTQKWIAGGGIAIILFLWWVSRGVPDKEVAGSKPAAVAGVERAEQPSEEVTTPGRPLKVGETTWIRDIQEGRWTTIDTQELWFDHTKWHLSWSGEVGTIYVRDAKHRELPPIPISGDHSTTNTTYMPFPIARPEFQYTGKYQGPVNFKLLCEQG